MCAQADPSLGGGGGGEGECSDGGHLWPELHRSWDCFIKGWRQYWFQKYQQKQRRPFAPHSRLMGYKRNNTTFLEDIGDTIFTRAHFLVTAGK